MPHKLMFLSAQCSEHFIISLTIKNFGPFAKATSMKSLKCSLFSGSILRFPPHQLVNIMQHLAVKQSDTSLRKEHDKLKPIKWQASQLQIMIKFFCNCWMCKCVKAIVTPIEASKPLLKHIENGLHCRFTGTGQLEK